MSELNYILKGYKKTLLGIVPQNWEVKSIEDIFITFPNASYSRQQISRNGDVKYIHYGDIHTKYTYVLDLIDDSIPTITEEQASRYTYLRNGDLIMTDASEDYTGVGKCIEIVNTNDTKAVSGLHTISLRDTNSIYVDGFRKYLTQITNVKLQLEKRAVGTKVYSISYNSIKSCLVPVPPINEQKKIAAILDIWDKAIELQTNLIEKLELRKRALMQHLLTRRVRLSGFSDKWKKKRLSEIGVFLSSNTLSREKLNKIGGYIQNIHYGDILIHYPTIVNPEYSQIPYVNKDVIVTSDLLQDGDIVFADTAEDNTVGKAIEIVNAKSRQIVAGLHTIPFRPNNGLFAKQFLGYYINSASYQKQLRALTQGIKVCSISKSSIKNTYLQIPSLAEQITIAEVLMSADAEIEIAKTKLSSLRNQKRGLMQQLLTGKKRL